MPVSNTIIDLISYKSNSIEKKKKNDEKVINRQFWYFLGRQAPGGGGSMINIHQKDVEVVLKENGTNKTKSGLLCCWREYRNRSFKYIGRINSNSYAESPRKNLVAIRKNKKIKIPERKGRWRHVVRAAGLSSARLRIPRRPIRYCLIEWYEGGHYERRRRGVREAARPSRDVHHVGVACAPAQSNTRHGHNNKWTAAVGMRAYSHRMTRGPGYPYAGQRRWMKIYRAATRVWVISCRRRFPRAVTFSPPPPLPPPVHHTIIS